MTLHHHQKPIAPNSKDTKHHLRDTYTLHGPPFRWAAIGDSYTAGPGAGDPFPDIPHECGVTLGAYPHQLDEDWPYIGGDDLQLAACSGATTQLLIDDTLTVGGLRELQENLDVVVLTIGGNDVDFASIVRACLVPTPFHPNCGLLLSEKDEWLRTSALRDQMWKVYDGIFARLNADHHYQVYHILYPRLFNAETDWCNDQSLGVFPFYKPRLTRELRSRLNDLVDRFSVAIRQSAEEYTWYKRLEYLLDPGKHPGWSQNRLFVLNPDVIDGSPTFERHRFCEEGMTDPASASDDIWFFSPFASDASQEANGSYFGGIDPVACKLDSRYNPTNPAFAWDCDVAQYFALPHAQQNLTTAMGFDASKWFHPKTAGFTVIKNMLGQELLYRRPRHSTAMIWIERCWAHFPYKILIIVPIIYVMLSIVIQ